MSAGTAALAADLSTVDDSEFVAVFERAVEARGHDRSTASELGAVLRLALAGPAEVERLAGVPPRVHHLVADAFKDLQLAVEARRHILAMDMLDAVSVAELLGARGNNRREAASALRRRGAVIGLPVPGRRIVYPAFQFDPVERQVRPVVERVNIALQAKDDPWGAASWWASDSPRLDGATPQSLLGQPRERDLLRLARVDDE